MQNLILLWTALSNFFDLMPLEASKGKTISKIWISRLEVPNWQYRETISGRTKPPSFLDPSGQSFIICIVLIILAAIPLFYLRSLPVWDRRICLSEILALILWFLMSNCISRWAATFSGGNGGVITPLWTLKALVDYGEIRFMVNLDVEVGSVGQSKTSLRPDTMVSLGWVLSSLRSLLSWFWHDFNQPCFYNISRTCSLRSQSLVFINYIQFIL